MSEESLQPVEVGLVLAEMVQVLAEISWQKLGLRADAMTGVTKRDLPQAKLAIDAACQLADLMTPQLDDADKRSIQKITTDLRLNFVQQKELAGE